MAKVKPTKVVTHRKQSRPATCERIVGNWLIGQYCGEPLRVLITPSSLSALPYEELVVVRCPVHITSGHGIV